MAGDRKQKGQALVMVTLASIALFAMIGLAADLSWDYFVKRKTQSAADGAALGAIRSAFDAVGAGAVTCGANVVCQPPTECPSTLVDPPVNMIDVACLYARQNGYTNVGRQHITVEANTTSPYTTATGPVSARYWVSVVVTETVPQLWSTMYGNSNMTVASRATAAIAETVYDGNLILLDRQNDAAGFGNNGAYVYGENLLVQANDNHDTYAVQASGILMSSNCNGTSLGNQNCSTPNNKPAYAGMNQGGGTVYSPYTVIRTGGGVNLEGGARWIQQPQSTSAGQPFVDPMGGMGQPAAPTGLADVPVADGVIDGTTTPVTLYPGNYYATSSGVATGDPITLKGTIRFAACSGCAPNSAFGKYVIFGGLAATGGGADVTFDPGQYVFAGAKWRGNQDAYLLDTATNMNIHDAGGSVGELFVFTDLNYPGLQVPSAVQNVGLQAAELNIVSGNNGTDITLHGLNKSSNFVSGTNLENFAKVLFWQDQANSTVKYTAQGNIDTSCGTMDSPCTRNLVNVDSPQINLQASPIIHLYGVIYQPRGSWTTITAGSGYSGPLQLISGAAQIKANAILNLGPPLDPITFVRAGMIE